VPYDLYYYLPPPPYGCDYVMVGGDILLVALDTRLVIDAMMLDDEDGGYDNGDGYYNGD
jgi:hypothetical protein